MCNAVNDMYVCTYVQMYCCTVSLQCPDTYTLNKDSCECEKKVDSQCPTNAIAETTTPPCTCGVVFEPMCLPGWNLNESSCSCQPRPNPTCPHNAELVGNCACSGISEPTCVLWGQLNVTDCACHLDIPRYCMYGGKATADSCKCDMTEDPTCDDGLSLNTSTCECTRST